MNDVASEIRKWRKDRKLLRKEAADKLDVNLRVFRSWETGERVPGDLTLAELRRRMAAVPVTGG